MPRLADTSNTWGMVSNLSPSPATNGGPSLPWPTSRSYSEVTIEAVQVDLHAGRLRPVESAWAVSRFLANFRQISDPDDLVSLLATMGEDTLRANEAHIRRHYRPLLEASNLPEVDCLLDGIIQAIYDRRLPPVPHATN